MSSNYTFKFRQRPLDGGTKLVGLLAHPVHRTPSPEMWGAAFEELGLNFAYVAFDVKPGEVGDAIRGYRALGFRGSNVTMPHKLEAMQYMDELDPWAETIGSLNAIINTDGVLKGYNFDILGFQYPFKKRNIDIRGKHALLLGAGGGARACAYGLADMGAEVTILNILEQDAQDLAQRVTNHFGCRPLRSGLLTQETLELEMLQAEIVVNATSVGFAEQMGQSLIPSELFRKDMIVYDIVFDPLETKMLKDAKAAGAQTFGGLEMIVYQATLTFEKATEHPAPYDVMYDAAYQVISKRNKEEAIATT